MPDDAPTTTALLHFHGDCRVNKISGANLNGRRASHHKLDGVLGSHDASKTNDGDFHGMEHFIDHTHSHGLDSRTTESTSADAQLGATTLNVDGHTHQRIDKRHSIGSLTLAGACNVSNVGNIG